MALAAPGLARAAPQATDDHRQTLQRAVTAFDRAVESARSDPGAAKLLYAQAAADFEALGAAGFRNAALEYNRGVTHFRLGNLGRAILHFRRAAEQAPRDDKTAANLAYARQRVEPQLPTSGQAKLLGRLFFLHAYFSPAGRFWFGLVASIAGWAALAIWLRRRWQPLLLGGGVLVALAVGAQGSVIWQLHDRAESPPAVVVGGQYTLRLGRGEGYEPAMSEPLGPGVELRIVQERGDWIEVRLPNGITGWLPASAVERV